MTGLVFTSALKIKAFKGAARGSSGTAAPGAPDCFLLPDTKLWNKLPQHLLAGKGAKLSEGRSQSRGIVEDVESPPTSCPWISPRLILQPWTS